MVEVQEAMLAANSVATATARANLGNDAPSGTAGPTTTEAISGEVAGSGGELVGQTAVTRAEAVDASVGAAVAGGGTASASRAAAGKAFNANTQAAEVAVASAPASGGAAQGLPFEASGATAEKSAGGMTGPATKSAIGAAAGEVAVDVPAGQLAGTAVGRRQASSGTEEGPTTLRTHQRRLRWLGPNRRMFLGGLPPTIKWKFRKWPPSSLKRMIRSFGRRDDQGVRGSTGKRRRAIGGVGDGRWAGRFWRGNAPDVGIARRPASTESAWMCNSREARFIRHASGGLPSVNTAAVVTSEMFKRRIDRAQGKKDAGGGGAEPQTEDAIELGLSYLARQQASNGSWSLRGTGEPVALSSDTAATALSTLAFLGAGYHHRDFKFKETVRSGLDFLIKNQRPNGDLFIPLDDESNRSVRLYSHAIATMALCEAYLCTNDENLKAPAQKAIDFIVASQHKEQGGWRYTPGVSSDTSVTGWMIVALKYGRDAGLKIPQESFTKVQHWVDAAQKSSTEKHLYRYNPYAPNTDAQRHGRDATKTMTAVGLVMRIYLGKKRQPPIW